MRGTSMKKDIGLLVLRVGVGALMLPHGWGKLMNFSNMKDSFPDPIGLGSTISLTGAVFAEVFCAIAIIIGLFTRFACIPLLVTMLVAAFIIHGSDPWSKKEFALLYAIPFLSLIFTGSGSYSVDRFIGQKV